MKIYNDIFNERKLFAKGTPENQIKKIQLNASKQNSRLIQRCICKNWGISVKGCDADTEINY